MHKYCFFFREGSKINQVICAILINVPAFVYGSCIGWMSPMTLLLQSKDSPRETPLTNFEFTFMAAVAYVTCMPASFFFAAIGDRVGRKNTVFILSATGFCCWATLLLSMETWAFVTSRALVGVLMGGAYVTCPMFTKEISEDCIRGMLGSLVIIFHTTGNLFSYIIGDFLSYRTVLWVCLAIPAVHMVLFMMMPDSPSYLVKMGDFDEAARCLAWLRCRQEDDPVVLNEVQQIKKEQTKDEDSNKFVFKAIVSDKVFFRAFKIVVALAVAREFCGAIPVLTFAGEIFDNASNGTTLVVTPNQQAMMLGSVQVIGSLMAFSLVEKTGRKFLFCTTAIISGLSMCALASWFVARDHGLLAVPWLPILTLCLCIFCDSLGLQPISVIVVGEMFSFKFRSTVMAVCNTAGSISALLQMLLYKPTVNVIGYQVAFYCFGAVCLIAAAYTILVMPETKMKGLDEIYNHLKTKKEKKLEADQKIIDSNI